MSHLSAQLDRGHFAYVIDNSRGVNSNRTQPVIADMAFIGGTPVGSVMFISPHVRLGVNEIPYRGDPKRVW